MLPISGRSLVAVNMSCSLMSLCMCVLARYYSVMWCKASSRKHKRWEGDAVLVASGRSVVLKDMEGRDIGRGEHTTTHS